MRLATKMAVVATGVAVAAALVAPQLHARHEANFLRIDVNASAHALAGAIVTIHVHARNVHPDRRRVYTAWVDVSESLGRAGTVALANGEGEARWVPIARAWRMPFEEEISPGESRDVVIRVRDVKAGHYAGTVDVVLDGTSWVSDAVAFDVTPVGSQSAP